jgi:microcystin-dependent protein
VALIAAAALMARAYDTTWIATSQPLSSVKLKADLDEIQSRLSTLESAIAVPSGTIVAYGSATAPAGWLLCDGTQYSGVDPKYVALYAAIGTAYGGNSTSQVFNVPDLRGRFLRGVNNGTTNDPDAAARTASQSGGNTGDAVGSLEGDAFASHSHLNGLPACSSTGSPFNGLVVGNAATGNNTFNSSQATGGSETRPKNLTATFIIKL